jgi:hypothetical protein
MKIFLISFAVSLVLSNLGYAQRLYDNGPFGDENYVLQGAKWNKTTLNYYIYNTSSHLTATQRESAITEAFQLWSDNSVLSFIQVSNPNQADLKIKWASGNHGDGHPFDGNSGVLAHAYYPPPAGGSYAGELHFDDDESWSIDGTGIDLITVAAHEIGHLLGIAHSDVVSALMYPYYFGLHRYLDIDDQVAIWELYGYLPSISGPDNPYTFQQVTYTVGSLPAGATVTWSGSSNISILSGQGTSQVTVSICGDNAATLTATLSGAVSQVLTKNLTVNNGNLEIVPMIGKMRATLNNSSGQCLDWYIPPPLVAISGTTILGSGSFNCSSLYSLIIKNSSNAMEEDWGYIQVRAKKGNCNTPWLYADFVTWRPVIDVNSSELNPSPGQSFYAVLEEPYTVTDQYWDSKYWWHRGNTPLGYTYVPYISSSNWQCGNNSLSVVVVDGADEVWGYANVYGNCTAAYSFAYPNPASSVLHIEMEEASQTTLQSATDVYRIQLVHAQTGAVALNQTVGSFSGNLELNVSTVPDGLYNLVVTRNSTVVHAQAVLIQH